MLVFQFRIRAYFFSTGEGAHDVRVDVGSAPTGAETLNPQTLSDHLFSKQAACQLAHVSIKTP